MRVGLYPMVADVLHTGHILAIEEAKQNCDYLVVALHCCPDYKSPVQSIYERFMQLRAIKWIDEVIPYENKEDAKLIIESFNFDVYFLGEDYKNRDFENKDVVQEMGKEIFYLSRKHNFSSTNLKIRIVDKEMNLK
jgi:glycerol-3-phosphate cytidylyltransferase